MNIKQITSVDFSHTNLKSVSSRMFLNASHIFVFNLSNNPLSELTLNIFHGFPVKAIMTSSAHICCLMPHDSCIISVSKNLPSCSPILPHLSMKLMAIVISTLIFSLSTINYCVSKWTVLKRSSQKSLKNNRPISKSYELLISAVSFGNVQHSINLLTLVFVDFYYQRGIILKQHIWQKSIPCFFVHFTGINYKLGVLYFLCLISFAR